ncbi:MAG TPA: translation elongation factor Ts [Dehalococcoidia bacterium]
MPVTPDQIRELRELTSAGVMDCKRALEHSNGDVKGAIAYLAEQGIAAAAKRSERETGQGVIESYVHNGRVGVLVEVNCETDFVARTEDFQKLAREVALQIAGLPWTLAVSEEQLPADFQPVAGQEAVLLKQASIRDSSKTIQQMVTDTIAKTGENIQIRRFARFELGQ